MKWVDLCLTFFLKDDVSFRRNRRLKCTAFKGHKITFDEGRSEKVFGLKRMLILPPFAQCAFEGNIESVLRPLPTPRQKRCKFSAKQATERREVAVLEVREYVGDAKGSLEPLHKFSHERSWSWQWKVRSAVVLFRSSIELFSSFGWLGLFFALCPVQTLLFLLGDSPDDFLSGNYAMSPTSLSLPLPPLDLAASVAGAASSAQRDALRGKKEKRKKKALRSVFLRVVVGRGYATFPTIQSGRRRRPFCILLPIPSANKATQTKRGRGDGWGRTLAKY